MTDGAECGTWASAQSDYAGLRFAQPEFFVDPRGRLCVFEHEQHLGFVARRTFFLEFSGDGSESAVRAEHATSCNQLIVTLRGAIRIELDNGTCHCCLVGVPLERGFLLSAGVWRRIIALENNTLVMVLADASYADTTYFPVPVPELITSHFRS